MTRLSPLHSRRTGQTLYHENTVDPDANAIPPAERIPATADLERCLLCARV